MLIRILGFGSIGRGLVPLLIRNGVSPLSIHVFDKSDEHADLAHQMNVAFTQIQVTKENYQEFVRKYCTAGDVLLNLAVDVSSKHLLQETLIVGAHYLDTCVEPWSYADSEGPYSPNRPAYISNAILRAKILFAAERLQEKGHNTTSIIAHGANPGLITYFVKQGLHYLRDKLKPVLAVDETDPKYYARLACELGVKVIQVAEYDTQIDDVPYQKGEFHNTWSIDGFKSELYQAAEMGIGTHERHTFEVASSVSYTYDARSILLNKPTKTAPRQHMQGYQQRVKTWTPGSGAAEGWLITHHEALSVNGLLRFVDEHADGEQTTYAPTVYYAYQPCPKAQQSILDMDPAVETKNVHMTPTAGYDQLGALIMYEGKYGSGAVWTGSTLDVTQCGIKHNPPTTMQVTASIWAAVLYMMRNPNKGILEAEDLPWEDMLRDISPYLGTISTVETDWNPGSLQLPAFLIN